MRRFAVLLALFVSAAVGVGLVVTSGSDDNALDRVTTVDGVEVDVPRGWVVSADIPFRYEPPGSDLSNVDSWTVAWACGPDGCAVRSLADWLVIGRRLETFRRARADEGVLLFDLTETEQDNARILTARTTGGQTVVTVAAFHDGADHYLECNLAVAGDPGRLDQQIIDACGAARFPG